MRYEITIGGQTRSVEIDALGEEDAQGLRRYRLQVDDGPAVEVERAQPVADVLSLLIDGRAWEAGLVSTPDGYDVELIGVRHGVSVVDPRRAALRLGGGAGGGDVVTMMPGRVVALLVAEGQAVAEGDPVIIVEAMKMENQLKAPVAGTVKSVRVAAGDLVEARTTLLEITPA